MKTGISLDELVAVARDAQQYDFVGQVARMLLFVEKKREENHKVQEEGGQQYARPYQLAKRYGYSEEGLRRFLYKAEQSGKVRILKLEDEMGKGNKLYNIDDFEKFFTPLY